MTTCDLTAPATGGLRFRSLASGSAANATLLEGNSADGGSRYRVLVDCGLNQRQLGLRMKAAGLELEQLDAVFVTHEHSDHVGICFSLAAVLGIPVWSSYGTWVGAGRPDCGGWLRIARDGEALQWGAMKAVPFTVPHDAREPLQLSVEQGCSRIALLTDLGFVTEHVLAHVHGCHALLLEFNHDAAMLARSGYPPFLKRRISGRLGHLSNEAAGQLLASLMHAGLQHVVAGHLSRNNNCPELVMESMCRATSGFPTGQPRLHVAAQQGCEWIVLETGNGTDGTDGITGAVTQRVAGGEVLSQTPG